jgi:hypothetical protein
LGTYGLNFGMVILHPSGIVWVSTVLYSLSGVKWLGDDGDQSPQYITGVKNEWSYISASFCSVSNGNFVYFVQHYRQANARK